MAGRTTKDKVEFKIRAVLSFIFLFRYVTVKDLNLLGCTLLEIKEMRRTIEYLLKHGLIDSFVVCTPVKTSGYFLLAAGLKRLPKALLEYKYSFSPKWYRQGKFWHDSKINEICIMFQKLADRGYWMSDWMIRQQRVQLLGKDARVGLSGASKKNVTHSRMPDGVFVVSRDVRIAIEYELTRKNINAWTDMINDLEYGLKLQDKISPHTNGIVKNRDFEAVLFVFDDPQTFSVYRRRFDDYSISSDKRGRHQNLPKPVLNPQLFFLTTFEDLKQGKVFSNKGELGLNDMFNIVENEVAK